jgi:stage II sporulation protein E
MPDKVASGFNKAYLETNARILARNDVFEAKKAAANQFSCIGALIDEAADSIERLPPVNPSAFSAIAPVFGSMGFEVTGICEYETPSGRSCLQVYCSRVPVIPDKSQLLEAIYEATGKEYLPPVIDEYTENGTILSFTEEGKFRVSCHTATHTGAGEQFSGDTLRSFFDGQGCFYAVLSDGMGTGTRAAIDSVMTANLTARLLRAGFSPENALKTVNCALLIKSAEETLATLDILKIDLETGKAVFYKAGAGFSVIGKSEKTLIVEKSSMPLGILENTSLEKSEIDLNSGDTVLIMSDGANVIPHKQFRELIKNYRNEGMEALSEAVVKDALTHSVSGKHDDITVCAVRIR